MKNIFFKFSTVLLFCIVNTALVAQQKKHKTVVSPVHIERIPAKKQLTDSLNRERIVTPQKYKHALSAKPVLLSNLKSKKVVLSIPCKAGDTVLLRNMMYTVHILTWDNNKVSMVATVEYEEQNSLTDSQWLSKMKLSMHANENKISVLAGDFKVRSSTDTPQTPGVVFPQDSIFKSAGSVKSTKSLPRRDILLYVPQTAKVEIDSKYADIRLENNIEYVKATINNGTFTMKDAAQFQARGEYASIYAGKIGQAEINITNGKLETTTIDSLGISSTNSSIVINKVFLFQIAGSRADQYNIGEVTHISGAKAFGGLQITTLAGSVELSGDNTDVKIKRINPSASTVKINTQYAKLELPVVGLKNYTVAFKGDSGSSNTPFKKMDVTTASFNAAVGSKLKPTVFQLSCKNCSVDFN